MPEFVREEIGDIEGRTAPAMLDKDTMFYSFADFEAEVSSACIWRATAQGDFPDKIWTEDPEPVFCTTAEE